MAERVISNKETAAKRRPSALDLSPTLHYDELIRDSLECGKFPLTKTAWIKVVAMILSLAGLALFLGQSVCKDTPSWYPLLFPICVGVSVVVQATLYLIFSTGSTAKSPGMWVKADIFLNLGFAVLAIVASILTTTVCSQGGGIHGVPGPIGIAGGILQVIGCVAIFLMYRFIDEEDQPPPQSPCPATRTPACPCTPRSPRNFKGAGGVACSRMPANRDGPCDGCANPGRAV